MFARRKRKKHNQVRDWPKDRQTRHQWTLWATENSSPLGHVDDSLRLCSSVDSIASSVSDIGDVIEADMRTQIGTDVDRFSQAVSQLKSTLSTFSSCGYTERGIDTGPGVEKHSGQPTSEERATALIAWLAEVKTIVISVLNKHPQIHSTSVISSLGSLMSKFKEHSEKSVENVPGALEALEQLDQAFITSVTEYVQGEPVDPQSLTVPVTMSRESSLESILDADASQENVNGAVMSPPPPLLPPSPRLETSPSLALDSTADETCLLLMRLENGMELMLEHCKLWSRFMKELAAYVEKKTQFKLDYCARLMKLTRGMRETLVDMDGYGLPFSASLNVMLEQELDLFRRCHDAFKTQVIVKFIEPLSQHRDEHEKVRKTIKESWGKHQKKVTESVSHLKKARSKYMQLCEDRERASAKAAHMERFESGTAAKLEKKKQQEEDLKIRASDAEHMYKQCVDEANLYLANMETYRDRTLDSMCHAFIHYEDLVRSALLDYTQLEKELVVHVPEDISNVEDGIKKYSLGSQLVDTIRSHTDVSQSHIENGSVSPPDLSPSYCRFAFEPFSSAVVRKRSASYLDLTREEQEAPARTYSVTDPLPFASPSRKPGGLASFTAKLTNIVTGGKDSDTETGGRKNLAIPDRIPPILRAPGQRKKRPSSIAGPVVDGIKVNEETLAAIGSGAGAAAVERSPGRYPGLHMFRGFKDQFKDAMHFAQLGQRSPRKRTGLSRRPTFFGVDLCRQLRVTGRPVPLLVSKCVEELNYRGLNTQGLYRIPAAQSKIKDLCRRFETDAEGVDLSDTPPHVLASVLKYYLRQLPQPLLTYKLYPQFVSISKKWQTAQTTRLLQRSPKIHRSQHRSQRALSHSFDTAGSLLHQGNDEKNAAIPRSTSQGLFQSVGLQLDSPEGEEKAEEEPDPLVAELRTIVDQLSKPHYATAATLIDHLTKVVAHEAINQMNASNLAIVFGPNILRPRENEASLSTLTDMQHQLKAVEMLIIHSEVFDTKQYVDEADTRGYAEDVPVDESSDEDQLIIQPRLRRHSIADLLSSPPPNPGTPPLRKRQSMTELEDLFSAVADANKQRLNAQRTQVSFDLEPDEGGSETGGSETPKEERRERYANEFRALQTELLGRTSSCSPDICRVTSPEIHRQPRDVEGSVPVLSLPGAVDDDQNTSMKRLSPPTRLSPLSHSLVEHFNINIRMATSPSSSLMNEVMREAARAAQSTNIASKRLSQYAFPSEKEDSPERRARSQSPVSSPVIRTPARRSESDIVRLAVNITDGQPARGSQSSEDDDESSVLELLITGSPRSGQNRCFVSAATVARRMHTTTLEEDIKKGASDHTHTCTATLTPSESKGMEQSSSSLASLREDISGLMQRFDEQISVLETPPGSPAFVRRRHRAQMKKKKAKSSDNLVTKPIEEQPLDSVVQSLDSLLSTSEELLTSPLPTEPGIGTSSHPVIKVSAEEEKDQVVQVKTDWRADESVDSVVGSDTAVDITHPVSSDLTSDVTMGLSLDRDRDRDSGISDVPHAGTTARARSPETSPSSNPKTRKPAFV